MSIFHVKCEKTITVDGVEYSTDIEKDIIINFADAGLRAKECGDEKNREIELISESYDFLHELTDIFPLSEYDIKIMQFVSRYKHLKNHPSIHFDIQNKKTGEEVYFADGPVLSDKDYDYIRDILMRDVPRYGWQTAKNYLRSSIERCMGDDENSDLFTDDAWNFLTRMTSARYMEYKTDGYVDYDFDLMKDVTRKILEDALRDFAESGEEDE
ncbi:MAG: hypothetical protein J6M44_17420 [Butyrivibrio sp.]|uniref:hypothetical protein n=1 Tax=Butyrivibrio sp. TaxID=28121 RepID=UPI001B4A6DF4|nr:hypothetical protein [Butyrivibrio sp.]MBP3280729.1 hypothetical protein [Butyrivibrio sp.]MBP3782102.1 hypothetical protein [Butyrivibrio sp.]